MSFAVAMTFSEFCTTVPDLDFAKIWCESDAFIGLRQFWASTLPRQDWFVRAGWRVDGLSSLSRPEGDLLAESYGLTTGNVTTWDQLRFFFTTRFIATGTALYDLHILEERRQPNASDEDEHADDRRTFLRALENGQIGDDRRADLEARYVPLSVWTEGTTPGDVKIFASIDHTDANVATLLDLLRDIARHDFAPEAAAAITTAFMRERYGTADPWRDWMPRWERDIRTTYARRLGLPNWE